MKGFLIVLGIGLLALFGVGVAVLNFNVTDRPLHLSLDELPPTTAGDPYSVSIGISGNASPVSGAYISKGELPVGLDITLASGSQGMLSFVILAGIPAVAGTYTFTIAVSCAGSGGSDQTGEKEYNLVV